MIETRAGATHRGVEVLSPLPRYSQKAGLKSKIADFAPAGRLAKISGLKTDLWGARGREDQKIPGQGGQVLARTREKGTARQIMREKR